MPDVEFVQLESERRHALRWPDHRPMTFYAVQPAEDNPAKEIVAPFIRQPNIARARAVELEREYGGVWWVGRWEYDPRTDRCRFAAWVHRVPPTGRRP